MANLEYPAQIHGDIIVQWKTSKNQLRKPTEVKNNMTKWDIASVHLHNPMNKAEHSFQR